MGVVIGQDLPGFIYLSGLGLDFFNQILNSHKLVSYRINCPIPHVTICESWKAVNCPEISRTNVTVNENSRGV